MSFAEKIIHIEKAKAKNKKYSALVQNKKTKKTRKINFGDTRYEQYKDSTELGLYSSQDHGDAKRRKNYFSRHSGVEGKAEAIKKETEQTGGLYNARILSHKFLW